MATHNDGFTRTALGYAASEGATPDGTDLQATVQDRVRAHQARQVDAVRARTAPGDHARLVGLARAHQAARRQAAENLQAVIDATETRRAELTRTLYGRTGRVDPTEAISRRDAADRAAGLTDHTDAITLLRRAERSGDEHLAQAVAARAAELRLLPGDGWGTVLTEYASTRPAAAEALGELADLANLSDFRTRLAVEAQHYVPVPDELAHLRPTQIESLANADLADLDG